MTQIRLLDKETEAEYFFNVPTEATTFTVPVTLIPGRRYYVELRVLKEKVIEDQFVYWTIGTVLKKCFRAGKKLYEQK